MLPLECLYLNKNALINVVGQPVSHRIKTRYYVFRFYVNTILLCTMAVVQHIQTIISFVMC